MLNASHHRPPASSKLYGLPSQRAGLRAGTSSLSSPGDDASSDCWWAEVCPRFLAAVVSDQRVAECARASGAGEFEHRGLARKGKNPMVLAVLDTHEHRWHLIRPSGPQPKMTIGGSLTNLIDVPSL